MVPMDVVIWERRPRLRRPIMIAAFEGWNDAADAATGALDYLARSWQAQPFAEINPEEFYDFTSARPESRLDEAGTRRIEWPGVRFSAASVPRGGRDVVLMSGQEPQLKWRTFSAAVSELARDLGVEMVLSLGALLADVAHTRPVRVTATTPHPGLGSELGLSRSRYEGPTGILGVLQDALSRAGIPAASLWANVPHYVAQSPSPKATLALVERATRLLRANVDVVELQLASAAYDRQVDELVAADEDASAYVARLERDGEPPGDVTDMAPLSAEELAEEAERYLREQGG